MDGIHIGLPASLTLQESARSLIAGLGHPISLLNRPINHQSISQVQGTTRHE